ncbi:HNH endonuclease signature motif containing protein [Cellulomonas sp. Root137]|uniref:HNH endonuclease signature motif containing protein n=1 Tax=Cellulomonas sp. Root137 TaxID=1736459 RepID=UPI0006FBE9D2|nr:HNH endonuclease signature motif containing protein [Cellulomonas sp. Root137]KQY44401.1 hypothetical protein ASD18_12770 [Cellulomonas sp. Root137]
MFESTVEVQDVAAQVRDATATLAAVARESRAWSGSDRSAVLALVRVSEAALAEARAHLLVADRDAGDSMRPGDRSFEAAHARMTRSGLGEAARVVRQADAMVSMGTVAAGVRDGVVPLGHLDELARIAGSASPEVAAVLRSPQAQEVVVGMARSASRPDFARALARWVAAQDPAGLQAVHDAQHRERFFTLSAQGHGVFLKGRLDRVAGETLRVALDAMGQYGDDTRSPGQASADALTMLAEHACAARAARPGPVGVGSRLPAAPAGEPLADTDAAPAGTGAVTSGAVSRPHLSLLVPAETVAELLAHQRALHDADTSVSRADIDAGTMAATGAGAGRVLCAPIALPWGTVVPATLEDGTPVPMSELAKALCEADITRVVMSAESLPLDVGRSKRLFTTAQRRAAVVRDGQCTWNGCAQHASRCEVHHVRWWDRDRGDTSISNAALLCKHHHSEVHRLNLSIQRLEKPPGWTRRQRITAHIGGAGQAVDGNLDAPTTTVGATGGRQLLRYVFRDHRGHLINAPDGKGGAP